MPDTDPVIDDIALVEFVLRTARDTASVNVFPAAAITKALAGHEMTEFGLLRAAGAVAFTDGRRTIASAQVMRRALTYARDFGAVIAHETQDADLAASGVMNEGLYASWLGLPGIPREAEVIPLERDLRLARLTGGAYHAAKISTGPRRRCGGARQGRWRQCDGRRVDQPSVAQRERRRRIPHLLPAFAAAQGRGGPDGHDRGAQFRCRRHHRLLARPAGRRHQAPALLRRRRRRDRPGDAAGRRAAPAPQRRGAADAAGRSAVDGAREAVRPAGRDAGAGRDRPTWRWSISTCPGSCARPTSARAPRTPASRARGFRARSCKPW